MAQSKTLSLVLGGVQAPWKYRHLTKPAAPRSKTRISSGSVLSRSSTLKPARARFVDPLGGSYLVESLTGRMKSRIRARINEIEAAGDPEQLSASGFFREIFQKAMEDSQYAVEKGDVSVVGVNVHTMTDDSDTLLREIATSKIKTWHSHHNEKSSDSSAPGTPRCNQQSVGRCRRRGCRFAQCHSAVDRSPRSFRHDRRDRDHDAFGGWNAGRYFQSSAAATQNWKSQCRVSLLRSQSWVSTNTKTAWSRWPGCFAKRR